MPSNNSGSVKNKYTFTDANDYSETSFYRLKQVDNDNRVVYTKVVLVKGYADNEQLSIYPNPVWSNLVLTATMNKASAATINIYDAAGRLVLQLPGYVNKGDNVKRIDLPGGGNGIYLVKLSRPGEKLITAKFVRH